jgi:hypothetical protein
MIAFQSNNAASEPIGAWVRFSQSVSRHFLRTRWASHMRWILLIATIAAMQASATSMQCEPIEEDLARIEINPHPRGSEVFIHVPVKHKKLDLSKVSVSYGDEVTFELALWPGENDHKFGVIYLEKRAGRFSVLASYQSGACTHEMRQEFNVGRRKIGVGLNWPKSDVSVFR